MTCFRRTRTDYRRIHIWYLSLILWIYGITLSRSAEPGKSNDKECSTACPKIYLPVCAWYCPTGDKKTFGNQCMMNAANCEAKSDVWRYLRKGPCKEDREESKSPSTDTT